MGGGGGGGGQEDFSKKKFQDPISRKNIQDRKSSTICFILFANKKTVLRRR